MYENELSKIEKLLEEKKLKEQAVLQAREDIVRTIDQNFGIKKMIMEAAREVGTGLNGKDGRDGKDGFHGLDGYTPIKGIDYFDGLNGRDGKDGKNGIDGKNGRDGLNGKNGTDGRNGTNGKNGKDGGSGKGRPGKDAFLYAQEAGYTGTEQEFTIALKNAAEGTGGEGTGGEDGKSAYEIWLELGNTGTEQNFIDSLKGADGEDGYTPIKGVDYFDGAQGDTWGSITGTLSAQTDLQEALNAKQVALVSGENIKTVGGVSILGSGDIPVSASKTRKNFFIENDFMYNNSQSFSPWFGNAIGSGTIAMVDSDANHPGQLQLSSSATANSGYYILFNPASILISGSESAEYIVKTPSGITSTAKVKLGFQDVLTYVDPTDGAWMNMGGSTLTGKTANNGSVSATGTSYTILANTIYRATIEVNADATLVTFSLYTDNSTTPTWTDTLATNIPTAKGRNVGHGIMATNGGSSAVPLIIMDYMNLKIDRELAR